MKLFFSLILIFSLISVSVAHPLVLGLLLIPLISSVGISMCLYKSVFFGFVLFMVIVGGMLVIFAYASALSPSPSFSIKKGDGGLLGIFFFLFFWMSSYVGYEGWENLCESIYSNYQLCSMNFSYSWGLLSFYLSILLLVMMVAVSSVCNKEGGSLESSSNV